MLKKITKFFFRSILILLGVIIIYLIAAFTLPYITVNNDYKDIPGGIKIFVLSSGVHTDIVVPAKSKYKDWTTAFPKDSFDVKDSVYSHIGFGWGDKGFYLYTPEWSDLKVSTALKATCGLGGTAMHVHYLKERKKETDKCIMFTISQESYMDLTSFIENSFEKKDNKILKIDHPGYGNFDRFYEANGAYSLFKTCNVWTNKGVKAAGIRVACWSPFATGLMSSLKH